MKNTISVLFCAVLALLVAGCPRPFPLDVTEYGNSSAYPAQAAGFTREKIFSYRADDSLPGQKPDMRDVSVGYNLLTPTLQIASTIYVAHAPTAYPGLLDEKDPQRVLFSDRKAQIVQYHPGTVLLGESQEVLTKDGQQYTAQVATFRYDEMFMNKRQPVYSILMVWRSGDNFVNLRSTAPYAQKDQLYLNNLNLLNAVNWTMLP